MWKEETPVSRLIDELVGKKSLVNKFTLILVGAFTSLLFFTTWRWIIINKQKKITNSQEAIRQTCKAQTQTQMVQLKSLGEILDSVFKNSLI